MKKINILFAVFMCLFVDTRQAFSVTIEVFPVKDAWFGTKNYQYTIGSSPWSVLGITTLEDSYFSAWQFNLDFIPRDSVIRSAQFRILGDSAMNVGQNTINSCMFYILYNQWEQYGTPTSAFKGDNLGTFQIAQDLSLNLELKNIVKWWQYNRNCGFALTPKGNNNSYTYFSSVRSLNAERRPRMLIDYSPNFKMPLPGGKDWQLTVEAGGKSFDGVDDDTHKGKTHYSLDFTSSESETPILSMSNGYVYDAGFDTLRGNYVKVDCDHAYGDGDLNTGFQIAYLHMKSLPILKTGDRVVVGKRLGLMGSTGYSFGRHVHITFYFHNTAIYNYNPIYSPISKGLDPELNRITIEGMQIQSYKLNSDLAIPALFKSTNVEVN